jgi:capsular exopolysaccharide synthesis family protein
MEKNQTLQINEFTFKDIFVILKKYKWSIIFITILSMFLGLTYLYFKPNVYSSYAIIKVKPHMKNKSKDLINNTIISKSKDVTEEITLLKTFNINQKVLKEINFKVQYFIDKEYKKIEIYNDIPINIRNIKILNNKIIGKRLTLTPQKEGFKLQYINSYSKQLQNKIFDTKLFSLDDHTIFPYGEKITHKYFTLKIDKKRAINKPIHFVINGGIREIFENIIKKNLKVSQLEKDTSLIKISYQDAIPKRAKLYVNALIENFIEHSIANKNSQNSKTLKFILQELNSIKKELKESEQQLETYQESKSIVKPSVQGSLFIKKLSNIEIELSENNLKKRLIVNLINFVENNYNLNSIAPSLSKLGDQSTLQLITKLQDYQLKEEELSLEYTNAHPKLKSLRRQIENIRNKIKFNLKSLNTSIEYQNSSLIGRKNTYENELKTLPSQERHLVNIKRNYEVKSKMYEYLLEKEAENKIIQFSTFSDYQIIDHAYNSNKPNKNKSLLTLLVSSLIGFSFAFILALLRNNFNKHIRNQEDIEKLTSLPIYGTIPFCKQKKYSLKVHTQERSPFTESFRTLRTNLQFMKKSEKSATTILITSTIAGEGKSTVSANLATIFEKAKYKTLLINLDIRKPTLHHFFSINYNQGISTYLNSNNCNVNEIIFSTEFANLDIISSGPIVADPSELILSKRLPLLLKELKSMYEYIIIDTAPIGIVTDTKTIMQYSDLNLIILREDYAQKDFISTIEQMIEKHQFKNIGLLLNASKAKDGEYGYGYGYEYEQ